MALCIGAGVIVAWNVGGRTAADIAARVVAAGLASLATAVVFEWCARRLLPLAALLRMSLVFPDKAPSRFSVALRATSVRKLREWVSDEQVRLDGPDLAEKVLVLAAALNFHDRRTRGHSERTRALAELVIDELGLSEVQANEVRWGAFLHDVGKLLVPAAILNKSSTLTPAEWEQVRQHPAEGGRLVGPLRPFIGSGVEAVSCHHESFDGSGYPNGLRGEEIALSARIVAVADAFEVMTAARSYKRPMTAGAARRELVREAGRQFDPHVVRAFLNVSLGRLHWTVGLVAWAAEVPFIGIVPRAAAQVGAAFGASSAAVSTATLAGVATASIGASLMVSPLAVSTSVAPPAPASVSSVGAGAPLPSRATVAPGVTMQGAVRLPHASSAISSDTVASPAGTPTPPVPARAQRGGQPAPRGHATDVGGTNSRPPGLTRGASGTSGDSQGSNSQGSNSQGSNSQGSNSQGSSGATGTSGNSQGPGTGGGSGHPQGNAAAPRPTRPSSS